MTCIVAIEHEGKVWMGGDSSASREDEIVSRLNEKVFINGDFIIGYSGSFRIGQLLQYALRPPKQDIFKQSDMEYMVVDFVDCLRRLFREKGVMMEEKEGEAHDSKFLVGYHGKIYEIESDFHIGRPFNNYIACGSGAPYAMGVLYAMEDNDIDTVKKIEKALSASAEYCTVVKKPFKVFNL